jgi:hypothetical protein
MGTLLTELIIAIENFDSQIDSLSEETIFAVCEKDLQRFRENTEKSRHLVHSQSKLRAILEGNS